ncbi:alpha/beta-hydrolase [Exidia glandulosa HHB12029]|uniref:Alpha/beta-hydrolase n=1 Tax=Exidia glandulosa HHB12029 TaxID=1314781 RepID=A0A165QJ57_EXIGL|nr:alpha/beta-hydrolase [Exidia glandulosa HHB12029]
MLSQLLLAVVTGACLAQAYTVKPFKVSLSAEVPWLKTQLAKSRLPTKPIPGADNDDWGVSLSTLQTLRKEWLAFDWSAEEKRLNSYRHYTTVINNSTVHFVHEKSSHPDAIPILITHGWPGSFDEYLPVVRPLLESATATLSNGATKKVSFDVVLPSIPGFVFSGAPSSAKGWDMEQTAGYWNTLMVDVLGYKHGYAVAGSDWGGGIAWHTYDLYPTVRAAYLNFFPTRPTTPEQVIADNQTLTPFEQYGVERTANWTATGNGYFVEQGTKPNTIGLALFDNPVGQLAWISEKFLQWTDPTGDMTHRDVLTGVSLYYLTRSIHSSVFQYAYNPAGFAPNVRKANNPAPMGYGNFKWDVGNWPRYVAAQLGNLVFYRQHEKGGHFPGLDNPGDYVQDVRDFLAEHFTFSE